MHSRTPPRNRLAKVLPEEWRKFLVAQGAPKRKYTAVCRVVLAGGRAIDEVSSLKKDGLSRSTSTDSPALSSSGSISIPERFSNWNSGK